MAAAFAMGAEGINMGTRFMATVEAPIHPNVKRALVDTDETGTHHVYRSFKNTERVFRNSTTEKVNELEAQHPGDFSKVAHLARGVNYKKSFQETGDVDSSVWSCGQSIGLINDVPTCQQLLQNIMAEFHTAAARVSTGGRPAAKL
jgi:nitronate monooxygenase